MRRKLDLPYAEDDLLAIEPGDEVLLSGTLYVGRDQVHKRLFDAINEGRPLPFDFQGNAIYYMGPSPAPDGFVLGAAGPTTSMRMDPFTPLLADHGLKVIVGKGPRTRLLHTRNWALKRFSGSLSMTFLYSALSTAEAGNICDREVMFFFTTGSL